MRVVSLVPSLTEAEAEAEAEAVTDWCSHPADLSATCVGGTKNPDVAAVVAPRPAGDLPARPGVRNVYADHPDRYPEAFPALPAVLVDGRHLTWYGPSPSPTPAAGAPRAALR